MKFLTFFVLLLFLPAVQETPAYDNPTSPVDLLASYYDAINHQDYRLAHRYWETAPNAYDNFVRGFADTTHVQLIVQPPTHIDGAAGSLYAAIPTVLIATHTDETIATYAGCFTTRKSNLEPDAVWYLYDAEITEIRGDLDIPTLLAEACDV